MMSQLDFERAKRYALERLARDLPPGLCYHSLAHTRDEVAPAAEQLAALAGVSGEALLLLRTAAYYHDLGYVEQRADHEGISVRIAVEVLPDFGYLSVHIHAIGGMIMATKLPQTPHNLLEELLADADLDVLGRQDFWPRNEALRAELLAYGMPMTDHVWYSEQLKFLQTHRYWTNAAQTLCADGKQRNIAAVAALLRQMEDANNAIRRL